MAGRAEPVTRRLELVLLAGLGAAENLPPVDPGAAAGAAALLVGLVPVSAGALPGHDVVFWGSQLVFLLHGASPCRAAACAPVDGPRRVHLEGRIDNRIQDSGRVDRFISSPYNIGRP